MKYNKIKAEVKKEYKRYMNNCIKYIEDPGNDGGLRRESTATRWEQYKAGTITRAQAVEYAKKRIEKHYTKRIDEKLAKIEEIENADKVKSIELIVVWHRSRMWGYNPTAEALIIYEDGRHEHTTGSASGCGYDKLSAAVAEALNESNGAKKLLYDKKERARRNGFPVDNNSNSNAYFIAYGAGYGGAPYYEGGVGMSALAKCLEVCGLKQTSGHHTDTVDVYCFSK